MKHKIIVWVIGICWLSGCVTAEDLEWWQNGVVYQIFPRSFKDSDGDGVGDLKGIEEKADYLKELGIKALWLTPIFESPMVDFGYDVSDYYSIASIFGTLEDFKSLKRKLDSLNIRLILDFVPNHTSDQCDWFKKSVDKVDPYTDFYVWRNPSGWNDSVPVPPNNWIDKLQISDCDESIDNDLGDVTDQYEDAFSVPYHCHSKRKASVFNGPAWTYNEKRNQFYLHQFAVQQPDLNFRNPHLRKEIEKILIYWLDQGVDGFRMDSVAYLLENPEFPDEPINKLDSSDILTHESLIHLHSKDWVENYELVDSFHDIIDSYSLKDGKSRIIINEAYTSLENTIKFYDSRRVRFMPFNFLLVTDVNDHSDASDFVNVVQKWLSNMPENCWANWVIGNHDNSRVASRFGEELVDGLHMLSLLLPGTAFTYNGEEIGMVDGLVRWDQTLDPGAKNAGFENFRKFNRDPARTPFQWDNTTSAGFSTNPKTWLPVNSNYWRVNLDLQRNTTKSHFQVYKRLVQLRYHPTLQHGDLNICALSKWILVFTRQLKDHDTIMAIINLGSEEESVDLRSKIEYLPETVTVHTSSVNSEYEIGHSFRTKSGMKIRPKSALVLTTGNLDEALTNDSSLDPSNGNLLKSEF